MKKISFIKPVFPSSDELGKDFAQIVQNNFYTNSGSFEKQLEKTAAVYIEREANVSIVSNATVGLILAVKHLVGSPGAEKNKVIMQSFTFAAGAEAVLWCGLQPVFVDVDATDFQPNIQQTREYIKNNQQSVAAILLCNTFGVGNTNIREWEQLAKESNLPLIIDSAAGFGSKYSLHEKVGTRGDCEVFSLHATKPFAVGEGGLIVSRSQGFIEHIQSLKNFGFDQNREVTELGLNAKVPEIISAIGLRQLAKLDERIAKRQRVLESYKRLLVTHGLDFQVNDSLSTVPFVSALLPKPTKQQDILGALRKAGVEARSYYNPALHRQPLFRTCEKLDLTNTESICQSILSLPVHDDMSDSDISYICEIIAKEMII